ncbi:protein phosphatase 1 regulatory subunit 26 [Sceloporus undulatus]|uniref:protein phosphatase 1 regulatory subunit 26 n=1 Tax=Sceloporus undulatus TaxID=8520 RepID=UPI001C4D0FF8|nr:protein phosphatase 1 regulatory subunit 26 [Sceloporus undulatus]XP_042335661.1 protein phosphatase 1 regulatory subunit 26 [Sceloporus undulatus]
MFLMNTSTLVALQRKWEPFAQSRSCRYPVCFSESEDDIARSTVSAKVQVIINNLQSDESSLHSGSEYGCIMQKKQKGAKGRGHKLRRSGRVLQECVSYPEHDCPADSDGMEVEESSEFGPLLLHSDSDDSVDRDIEEAIQEYLKNKGQNVQPLPSNARGLDGEKQVHRECPWPGPAATVFPANVKANVVQQHLAPDGLGDDDDVQWAASPCSVSSDDSFEQSIKAEIEQFLNEKKQQARKEATAGANKRLDQKETQEKLAIRSQKEGTNRVSPSSQKRGDKALFLRRHPDLQDTSTPQCLKSKTDEEPAGFKTRQTQIKRPLAAHALFLEQSREAEKKQKLWKAREEQRYESKDISDSSSDDGIEEAIQLYQLEKIRKAADSQTACVPFEKEELRASRFEDLSAHLVIHSVKSALPEVPKKVLSSKRKQVTSKPEELRRMCGTHYSMDNGTIEAPAESNVATCAVTLQASCRADSAAELMCAEAILDISKTILPPPVGSDSRSFTTNPVFYSHNTSASQHESDSSTVDSDDSIEQEIRAFLAVKAQTEHLITKSKVALHSVQIPPSSGQPAEQIQSLKHTSPKPLKHSLSHKRKLKGESRIVTGTKSTQQRLSEMGYCSVGNNHSKTSASQAEDDFTIPQNRVAGRVARCPQDTLTTHSFVDFANPPPQRFLGFGKNATQRPQKCGVDDKSSSLDSDEDLDTAIKELLRSKRKLKKKSKDQRAQCKKKVRFGDSEMHVLEEKEKDCKSKKPTLLKSCLMNSQRDIKVENTETQNVVKGKLKGEKIVQFEFKKECQTKPSSGPDIQETSKNNQNLWTATSLTDDSSSIDSDDSIEQEIRRFLAEKSKDSTISTVIPVSNGIVENLGVTTLSKAKCQQFQGQSNALSKQRKKAKKEGPPMINLQHSLRPEKETAGSASHNSEQATSYTEDLCRCTVANSQENQGIVLSEHPGLPLKRTAEERKVIFDGKLNQRNLPPGKDKARNLKVPNCLKPLSLFKHKNSYEFKISSNFIAGLKSTRNKKKPVLLGKRQSTEVFLFKRQAGVSVPNFPGERCEMTLKRGALGSKSEAEMREADLPTRDTAKRLHPCISESSGKMQVATSLDIVAKGTVLGDQKACFSLVANQGSHLQEPSRQNTRLGVRVSAGLLHVEIPSRKGEEHNTGHEEGNITSSTSNLPPREKSLIKQDRASEEQTPKVSEGVSAEVTEVPVMQCTHVE